MTELHQTGYGRDFYGHHVPQITKSLGVIATEMKLANTLKARELDLKERELDLLEKKPINNQTETRNRI